MTIVMNRVLKDIQTLNTEEKSNIIKYLIASMDEKHDENSDQLWADVAQKRLNDIETKKIQTVSWDEIKQKILS
jgi:putative addiction module component (TIGR02574 family)